MQLTAHDLCAGYGNQRILHHINVTLPAAQITALLGPNGCGKSTLLKSFAGLLAPQQGEVMIDQRSLSSLSSRQLARSLALLPQQHLIPEGVSVEELVGYGRSPWLPFWGRLSLHDKAQVKIAMARMDITHLAQQRVTALSGGQRQRVFLAMLLAQDTPLVLLDEPTTWLDINHQVELMKLLGELKAQGKTVITVLHDLNQASRYCDHLVLLKQGQQVTQGMPSAVLTPQRLREVFQVDATVVADPLCGAPLCLFHDA
ncbi:ferric citrate ABC transporter ATP-binding protein FecE [Pantoea rodasii]|uniref:Ferric citrate ABC transporter ATP-binding protein FecE n=1 Tax=Pantoea rodasii TaxID=1076549 RepID=A0A2M9W601_9GAMM|nr:Fe(3+) dicitrate ABC transporter ATP-binding protein FecE [Pantoea rodasii]ORM65327.1 ferric citrate ABC transporter ATP-binding protein FecE [Pantoea rodasii]PJZ02962.1 ferric citrate ABC transporter ATP-binding protein FecE [Pantoea rodasii]